MIDYNLLTFKLMENRSYARRRRTSQLNNMDVGKLSVNLSELADISNNKIEYRENDLGICETTDRIHRILNCSRNRKNRKVKTAPWWNLQTKEYLNKVTTNNVFGSSYKIIRDYRMNNNILAIIKN